MKCLSFLFLVTASVWEDVTASVISVPASVDSASSAIGSVPIAAYKAIESVLSPSELYYGRIAHDRKEYSYPVEYNYGRQEEQWINGDQYKSRHLLSHRYQNDRLNHFDQRDQHGNIFKGVYQESMFDGKGYRDMFWIPKLQGRQGLGFQKRNYYSSGMRFPNTPEIQEPIGNRPLVKHFKYEPLQQYNY